MPGQVCRDGSAAGVLAALPEDPELPTATLQLTTIYNSKKSNDLFCFQWYTVIHAGKASIHKK